MKFTLGFSPCPNDTFIFDALVNKKIDTLGIDFNVQLEDVETLNRLALENVLDITKISYGVLSEVLKNYIVLNSGSALGRGVGPLLISKEDVSLEEVMDCKIAIPGIHTTAHKLFSLAFPPAKNKVFLRYDEIENFVLNGDKNDLGVIIHENRFTYQQKGLKKIIDLGDYWEKQTNNPIPLGGIVAKRSIEKETLLIIDNLIRQSIEYAFKNYPVVTDYVRQHSQEMEENVMRKHIDLYVNKNSIDLGDDGRNAIVHFMQITDVDQKNNIFLQHN